MSLNKTLIIDGDGPIYNAAFRAEEDATFDGETYYAEANLENAKGFFRANIRELQDKFQADAIICLSCPSRRYFRHDLYAPYKAPRGKVRRPLVLKALRDWVEDTYVISVKPGMEADDVVGILATADVIPGKRCVVSADKDLLQVPGPHIDLNDPSRTLFGVTPEEGVRNHYIQTLSGDQVDNYPGCPGIGAGRAAALVDRPVLLSPYQHEIQRGPREGESETRWKSEPTDDIWAALVSHFVRAGKSEDDALTMARVAKILTADDYDFDTKTIKLWEPPHAS